jgi:hypothetical protein
LKQMVEVRQVAAEALAEQTNQHQPSAAAAPAGDADTANTPVPLPDLQRTTLSQTRAGAAACATSGAL